MKNMVVFVTKSLCYHQVYLSDVLYDIYGDSFCFIQIREPLDFRVAAHQEGFVRPYLKGLSRSDDEYNECVKILKYADVIIVGEASAKIMSYFNKNALVLRYSERIFKEELYQNSLPLKIKQRLWYLRLRLLYNFKKSYLLSAGAYTPLDYSKFGLFKNKSFVWGYFPFYFKYNLSDLFNLKKKNEVVEIIWASRLIPCKHPESAIELAAFLKEKNISFKLHLVGDGDEKAGELKDKIISEIQKKKLNDCIILHGKLPAEEVLEFYKKCDIAIFTYSFSEGWGVGVNEAMNAGCAVVCAHSIGSARYLIENKTNGIIYPYNENKVFFEETYKLCLNADDRFIIGANAVKTITELWNYENAARRLSTLIDCLKNGIETPFKNGPCSKAPFLKEDWNE